MIAGNYAVRKLSNLSSGSEPTIMRAFGHCGMTVWIASQDPRSLENS